MQSSDSLSQIKPAIALSFDDGSTRDYPGYPLEHWNQLLLDNLRKHKTSTMLFVAGLRMDNKKGRQVLKMWNEAGHQLANHTYTHPNFNDPAFDETNFEWELLKTDSFINGYDNFYPAFRFPYLKEGHSAHRRDYFRQVLEEHHYANGHVTIDASDWYINSRLEQRLREDSTASIAGFRAYYIQHLFDRAQYYDQLAHNVLHRPIPHVLLLHHNLASALFTDDLIVHFKEQGWNVISTEEAYRDSIYQKSPKNAPAGESLIWALAKETGEFDSILRYPAEDSRYEKAAMDSLGL